MHPLDKGVDKVLIAFCTFPDVDTARKIVEEIVEARLAACGNILPQVHSIYRWQGKVESSDEALAIFKLDAARYAEFEEKLRSLHPYDVPEIISCKIDHGLPEYLSWVGESCAK
jgi:periplasmic divalent cation tolerance protein